MTTQINYQQLAGALLQMAVNGDTTALKAVSSTPTAQWGHGPTGTFSAAGLDQQVFNAMILPHLGLQSRLPLRISQETDPQYGIMTGVTAGSGSNPTGPCDDFPSAGLMKLCMQSNAFGRYGLQTNVYNLDRAGEITNRGEFIDLNLIGQPQQNGTNVPTTIGTGGINSPGQALNNEVAKTMFEFAATWALNYARMLYTGNPANNTAGGGYQEYRGMELLINTGYQDSVSQTACPAADSIVESFGNNNITDATANIVGKVQSYFHRIRHIASRAGLGQTRWVMTMPYGMFYRLSEVWAHYYWTQALNGLTFSSAFRFNLDGSSVTQLRDQFRGNLESRTGQFLLVDGQRIEVILDDSIPETEVSPGIFASDIYIVPMTVLGNIPVTFMEYFSFDSPGGAMDMARQIAPPDHFYTTDAGAYLWGRKPPTNVCVQTFALTKPRLVVRTPYIAVRISDVAWAPETQHERSPFTDSDYHVNGGVTAQPSPSFYPPTA